MFHRVARLSVELASLIEYWTGMLDAVFYGNAGLSGQKRCLIQCLIRLLIELLIEKQTKLSV